MCFYEAPATFTASYTDRKYMTELDYKQWEREQKQRIALEKIDDPKTVFGWALKGLK